MDECVNPHLHCLLTLKKLGIHTYKEAVLYLRKDSPICSAEGFDTHARVRVAINGQFILATLNTIDSDILAPGEASLSSYAWELLEAKEGDAVTLSHPKPLHSLSFVRKKVYGEAISKDEIHSIMHDITRGYYSDIHISAFISACAGGRLNLDETTSLTEAMVSVGETIHWPQDIVVDKHSVGGLPGNRTTLIVVPIVAAFGLTMPKTSSRAITSPSGSADTMECLAPVNLSLQQMRKVVEKENACIIWGGAVSLSPADDILIRVERALEVDSEGQLVASVLSKKIAAGSSHIVIDMPIGPTAKIRDETMANRVRQLFAAVSERLGIHTTIFEGDGTQPVGYGIGPALEARDVLAVLQNHLEAPRDLRQRSLHLAGKVLELSGKVEHGKGYAIAEEILTSLKAWQKFQAICHAQGGFTEPQLAQYSHTISANAAGIVRYMDNRRLTRLAKLAGAPYDKGAGVLLHAKVGTLIDKDQPLLTLYAESKGELEYALSSISENTQPIQMEFHV